MAAQLKPNGKLPRCLRRIATKQVKRILCELTQPAPGHQTDNVHSARKHLKKARAALRLVRDELGGRIYRRDNRHFRKVAQALSPHRDAQVQLQTVEELLEHNRGREIREALMKLHRVLQARLRKVSDHPNGNGEQLADELRAARRHARHWPVDHLKWKDLASGLGQTYRRGSKAFRRAARTRVAEDLHEWRKRVKDLWYQLSLLHPAREQPVAALAGRMKRLGQLLGDDHDLFMVSEAAKTAALSRRELEAILKLLQQSRTRLQKRAFPLGKRLFTGKPSRFIRRLEACGKTAQHN